MRPSLARSNFPNLTWPIVCAWLLALVCFSLPGRAGPDTLDQLDVPALAKVAVRLASIGVLGLLLLSLWKQPRFSAVLAMFAPLLAFVAWAAITTLWSPLKAVTVGQVAGLVAMIFLAMSIAILWKDDRDTSRILFHLNAAIFVFSLVMIGVHLVSPEISGLQRGGHSVGEETLDGIMHPTTAGATASLGLVLIVTVWFSWDWKWGQWLLVPCVLIHSLLIVLAASRMALAMAVAVLGLLFLSRVRPHVQALLVLAGCVIGAAMLTIDPRLDLTGEYVDKVLSYLQRGESAEQLTSLTGRTELWDAVWDQFWRSPFIGHGYFVTSHNGELDVWYGPANHSAHNTLLQILVSTGVVGLFLFLCGLGYPIWLATRSLLATPSRGMISLLLVFAIWFIGWAQLSVSFMGTIQPETVVFYVMFGLTAAQVKPEYVLRPRRAIARRQFAGATS